jgi:tRNA threonylcarbamoyladenosine biosynthesis protein TsaE
MIEHCLFIMRNEQETRQFASEMAEHLRRGDVLALEGDLGAGKTTFAQGIARGLGIERQIDSPTFTILKCYSGGRLPFYHMDVYRISGPEAELDLEEYLYGDGVCVVEWPSRIAEILPDETIFLSIKVQPNGERHIVFKSKHKRAMELCKELSNK